MNAIFEEILPLIGTLLVVVFIIYMSFLFSKSLAVRTAKLSKSKYMKVIDSMVVGQERMIAIIQINKRYFLIGITPSNMQLISEISEDDISLCKNCKGEEEKETGDFKDMFSKFLSHNGK